MTDTKALVVNLRVAILGCEKVGKTVFYRKLLSEALGDNTSGFDKSDYSPTFGFTTTKIDWTFNINNQAMKGVITLFDTAGRDLNQTLTKAHYSSFDAFIFVFDARDQNSVTYLYHELKRVSKLKEKVFGCIIGNTFGENVTKIAKQRTSDHLKGRLHEINYAELSLLDEKGSNLMLILEEIVKSKIIRAFR